jgi:hypothetical protein
MIILLEQRAKDFYDKYEVYDETTLQVYGAGIAISSSRPDKSKFWL